MELNASDRRRIKRRTSRVRIPLLPQGMKGEWFFDLFAYFIFEGGTRVRLSRQTSEGRDTHKGREAEVGKAADGKILPTQQEPKQRTLIRIQRAMVARQASRKRAASLSRQTGF